MAFRSQQSHRKMSVEGYEQTATTLDAGGSIPDLGAQNHSWSITDTDLRMFVEFMQRYNAQRKWNQSHPARTLDAVSLNSSRERGEDCTDYCKGEFYQLLKTYNSSIHGYVALMVNVR